MNREERQQARTDRYRELADNARKQSEQCFRQSESMASVIPMGQPVHGKADRNYREKIWNKMGQSVKASEKADYYERKAEAAENNNAIYLDDDNAVEKLEQKLLKLVSSPIVQIPMVFSFLRQRNLQLAMPVPAHASISGLPLQRESSPQLSALGEWYGDHPDLIIFCRILE